MSICSLYMRFRCVCGRCVFFMRLHSPCHHQLKTPLAVPFLSRVDRRCGERTARSWWAEQQGGWHGLNDKSASKGARHDGSSFPRDRPTPHTEVMCSRLHRACRVRSYLRFGSGILGIGRPPAQHPPLELSRRKIGGIRVFQKAPGLDLLRALVLLAFGGMGVLRCSMPVR